MMQQQQQQGAGFAQGGMGYGQGAFYGGGAAGGFYGTGMAGQMGMGMGMGVPGACAGGPCGGQGRCFQLWLGLGEMFRPCSPPHAPHSCLVAQRT